MRKRLKYVIVVGMVLLALIALYARMKNNIYNRTKVYSISKHERIFKSTPDVTQLNDFNLYGYQQSALQDHVNKYAVAEITLPRLEIKAPIYRGANNETLSLGVATYYTDYIPFGKGNVVIAGHSGFGGNLMFTRLHQAVPGDIIHIRTLDADYEYKAVEAKVIEPYLNFTDSRPDDDNIIKQPNKNETPVIHLFACIYTNDSGVQPKRFVVKGELIKKEK